MESWTFVADILALLAVALLLGALFERFDQSSILGYLLAGAILGPHAFNVVRSTESVESLAELGVSLLLFSIGLEFSWKQLRRLGGRLYLCAALQVGVTCAVGWALGRAFGLSDAAAFCVGGALALSSTACVLRVLAERSELDSVHGRNALGVLLFQDVSVIPFAIVISLLASSGAPGDADIPTIIATTLGKITLLIAGLVVLMRWVVPFLLGRVSASRELSLLLAVVVGLGATVVAHELKLPPTLGAFVAGLVLASSPYALQIRSDVSVLKTLLLTLFFASVGALADPRWILENLSSVWSALIAVVFLKTVIIWGIFRVVMRSRRYGLATGLTLAQTGEFSFVLAKIGQGTILGEETLNLIVSTTILALFTAPFAIRLGPKVERWRFLGRHRKSQESDGATSGERDLPDPASVVIGFGPCGREVAEQLALRGRVVVVDLNEEGLKQARSAGFESMVGDATQVEVLEHAGVVEAPLVVVTVPDPSASERVVHALRALRPDSPVIVRARYSRHRHRFETQGNFCIVDEESEVGKVLAQVALAQLENGKESKDEDRNGEPEAVGS